jgi:hypothetical protein
MVEEHEELGVSIWSVSHQTQILYLRDIWSSKMMRPFPEGVQTIRTLRLGAGTRLSRLGTIQTASFLK